MHSRCRLQQWDSNVWRKFIGNRKVGYTYMEDKFVCKECGGTFDKEHEYYCQECNDSVCYWCACKIGRLGGNLTICTECEEDIRKRKKMAEESKE